MTGYVAPVRDIRFLLCELLDVSQHLPGADLSSDIIDPILEAAATFSQEVISPLNRSGDEAGCSMPAPGEVRTPAGFREAYQQYCEAGWTSMGCATEDGGQDMPFVLHGLVAEIFSGANMAWTSYPGMSSAAYICLAANGDAQQRKVYLPRIASGRWAGTMCLTEPHAGTDLGLLRTRAVPNMDGSFKLTGTKIFISGGEQDLTENIVHLVLARLPDAPPGTKGISLFVVPKFLHDDDGHLLERNPVTCGSIEHKMGIRANSTCTMNFDGARGWLVGQAGKGLAAMFVMMNHARLGVGISALGQMQAAYQKALAYAEERHQGRVGAGGVDAGPDAIIRHADVRRMLLVQKAYVEGSRALVAWTSLQHDLAHRGDAEAGERLALVTPIVKAFVSDCAVECTSLAIQVFGGHGFIRETGVEQHLRDARIIPLYEGANGIQAMDLLGRKVLMDGGERLRLLARDIAGFIEQESGTEQLRPLLSELGSAAKTLDMVTRQIAKSVASDPDLVGSVAVPYLRLCGHVCLAWMWARMAAVGHAKAGSDDPVYADKIATARFYFACLLPEVRSLAVQIEAGSAPVMAVALGHSNH
ncbi:acyl-CoA dehydrogenase C-terminal domain-containing protein [Variovorax paradoxus]|nr:acyl-CoA dehydrogenase C-terminal domain-containing protein [Variovorax paradoxus]